MAYTSNNEPDSLTKLTSLQTGDLFVVEDINTADASEVIKAITRENMIADMKASAAETTTGTDDASFVTPDALAGSIHGKKTVQITVVDYVTDVATGDGKAYFHVSPALAGYNIVDVHAEVITAGTTGTTDIQLRNVTQTADILSTKLTIDSGETGSDTAATAAVIDAAEDDLTLNDLIAVDVDAVSTTAPQGLIVTIDCQLP